MDAAWGAPPPIPPIDPLLSSSNGLGLNFGAPTPAQTIPLADGTTLPWPDLNLDFLQFNFANLQPGPASTSVPLSGDAFLGLPTMSPEVFNSLSTECGVRLPSAIPNWLQRFDEVLATTPKDTFAVGLPHATISPAQGIQAGPSREGNTVSYGPPVPESPAQEKQAGPSRAGEELMNASTSRQAVFPPPAWSPASSHSPALMQSPSSLSNTSPSPYNSASPSPAGLSNALPLPPWGAIPTAPSDALEEELGAQRPGGSGGTDAARKRLERVMASAPKYKRQPAAFKVMMENPAAAREVMERVQVLAELELDMSSPSVKQRRRLITTAYGIFMGIARPELEPEMHWYRPIVKRYAEQFLYAKVLTTKGTKGEDRVRSRTLWQWFEILRWCIQMFTWDGDARLVGLRLLVQEGLLSRLEDVCLWIVREHKLRRHAGEMVYIGQPEFCLLVETQMKMTEVEGRLVGLQTLAAMTVQFLLGLRISTLAASNDEYLALGYVCTLYLLTSVAPSCIVHPFSLILTPMEAIPVLSRIITSIASNSRRGSVISFGASTDALQFMLNSAFEIYKRSRSQFAIRLHCENFKNGYGVEATYKIFEMEPCKFPQNTMFSPIAIVAYFFARGDLEFSTWEELLDSPASRLTLKNPSRPFLLKLRRGGHGFVEPDTPTNAMLVNAAYKRVMLAAGIPGSSHAFRHNVGIESNRIHGSATASMLLVHSEDNTVASRHYSRNTADFDMTALMSGEHPNAQDPDYIEKRTRALYTSSYVRAGIRRVHGMIGAAPTPNKIDIASLTLPAGLSLPQKRKNLVVLTPDEEMAVKNDARWVTSFASVKSTWDGICKYMPQLRAEKINDPNTFTRELKKAKAVAPDGLEPNAWQDVSASSAARKALNCSSS
ncbi:hypothetical protein CALVIDRAFT_26612 [Calocera viscosa TUFC12733]|uniref:Uncharacterized protein n=1 Tax=Calocera viscosa (strain TUFC12733) TaxID=1330018 RepID=A0A167P8M9_CALVF|nr:hypothetical protein CALVIDRAFT_26612 [Calocera viscosa TUFC12733]